MAHDRFHGRVRQPGTICDWPGCDEAGEFRAPGAYGPSADGPGDYRWFCLDHIRTFNAGYDYFAGMSAEQIWAAQSPIAGWASEARAFRPTAGIDDAPRWADFADPLDAISGRARKAAARMRSAASTRFTQEETRALDVLGLDVEVDLRGLRGRYSALVHRFHPDRNGGDRSYETRLQEVVEAYQLLRKAAAFR